MLGRSGSIDLLNPEHIYHGGETQVVAKENFGQNLYEGLIIPIHKGKAKKNFKPGSYRGITLSSVICKLFEVIFLHYLSPPFKEAGIPDFTHTAYQNSFSCADAIFARSTTDTRTEWKQTHSLLL